MVGDGGNIEFIGHLEDVEISILYTPPSQIELQEGAKIEMFDSATAAICNKCS
jgi:hypothetical protein